MSERKKIGTVQIDGKETELFGVRRDDGRWGIEPQSGKNVVTKPTFGAIKQAAAEMFAGLSYQFTRDQPALAVKAEVGEPERSEGGTKPSRKRK